MTTKWSQNLSNSSESKEFSCVSLKKLFCLNFLTLKINEFEYERTKHKLTPELIDKLIITLGPNGARHKEEEFPVEKVEIKDTSGAGDTFIASLVANYVIFQDISKAIESANDSATKVVQKRGVSTV